MKKWTIDDALQLCRQLEAAAPFYGCHIALTGGVLYKDGPRKDLDIVCYRIRQVESIKVDDMFKTFEAIGIRRVTEGERWCIKATQDGRSIDFFFPEFEGDYPRPAP